MSELEMFRDHCRAMVDGGHSPECGKRRTEAKSRWAHLCIFHEWPEGWGERPGGPPKPCVGDCISATDRALFGRMAGEVDDYLAEPECADDEGLFS